MFSRFHDPLCRPVIDPDSSLDSEITDKVATGSYVPPRAGVITFAEVYPSWSPSPGHISAKPPHRERVPGTTASNQPYHPNLLTFRRNLMMRRRVRVPR
jgi:hypothetical protein